MYRLPPRGSAAESEFGKQADGVPGNIFVSWTPQPAWQLARKASSSGISKSVPGPGRLA